MRAGATRVKDASAGFRRAKRTILAAVIGNHGCECHPRAFAAAPLRCLLDAPSNHLMHHEEPRGNSGISRNVWDRLMGTDLADCDQRLGELTARPAVAARGAEPS